MDGCIEKGGRGAPVFGVSSQAVGTFCIRSKRCTLRSKRSKMTDNEDLLKLSPLNCSKYARRTLSL